jgi:hypothetical protein
MKDFLFQQITLYFCQKFEHFLVRQDSDKLQVQRMKLLQGAPKLAPISQLALLRLAHEVRLQSFLNSQRLTYEDPRSYGLIAVQSGVYVVKLALLVADGTERELTIMKGEFVDSQDLLERGWVVRWIECVTGTGQCLQLPERLYSDTLKLAHILCRDHLHKNLFAVFPPMHLRTAASCQPFLNLFELHEFRKGKLLQEEAMTAHGALIVVEGYVMRYKRLFPQELKQNP